MRFRSAVPRPAFLQGRSLFSLFFHNAKKALLPCLAAGLLPALFAPTAVAQSSTYIPIFQFGIFYNLNLEMDPGQAMTINGPVFSNQGIWAGTANLTFGSVVAAVGQVNVSYTDPFCTGKTDSSTPTFLMAGQPTSGNNALLLAVGYGITNISATNAEAILNLPPPQYATGTDNAYSNTGLVYNFNACDLIISNSVIGTNGAPGTNLTIYFQDAYGSSYLNLLTNNEVCTFSNRSAKTLYTTNSPVSFTPATNYIRVASSFPWVTNVVFYDYREGKNVQAVQIDVAKLYSWLYIIPCEGYRWNQVCISHKNHPIDSISVYNSVPLTGANLPAVRLVNGQRLCSSYGLTISTPQPLYVLGDYNTTTNGTVFSKALGDITNTWPAGLMADAITVLSGNWSDAYTSGTALASRIPTATCINAAVLEGIVQSTNSNYSGGLENFFRLQEQWGNPSPALTYNGAVAVLFPSIYATNKWISPDAYYSVPKRYWGFNTYYLNFNKLPPLTPIIGNFTNPPVIITQPTNQTVHWGSVDVTHIVSLMEFTTTVDLNRCLLGVVQAEVVMAGVCVPVAAALCAC